ncbi:SprT family zinc-dependent metalloprotease [Sulfuricurvum sp.]|uniref:M48 family metallopeptidase n=1 Tax=Sulfuricurvum sp. TaxID=2025608 RepID=UPI002E37AF4D|nr:SprT family zinc-dependent metalloprotease [Sulfuricurvum sp.]HEX5329918.1 SprT family zinc-dependent metalloprotease [Sulfuricurvum sp.]
MFDPHTSPITIHYRPRNRNTYITITHNGEVCVRSPIKDEKRLRLILRDRESWIRSKLSAIAASPLAHHTLGETIRFRGECIPITQLPHLCETLQRAKNSIDIEKYYTNFYKNEAILTLPSRLAHYERKMGLHPKEIRFKKMRRRWGSCSSEGVVTLNTMMMQLCYEHIDYIIVHELAHLRHMNHSREFHALVRTILHNERELRRELKQVRIG